MHESSGGSGDPLFISLTVNMTTDILCVLQYAGKGVGNFPIFGNLRENVLCFQDNHLITGFLFLGCG